MSHLLTRRKTFGGAKRGKQSQQTCEVVCAHSSPLCQTHPCILTHHNGHRATQSPGRLPAPPDLNVAPRPYLGLLRACAYLVCSCCPAIYITKYVAVMPMTHKNVSREEVLYVRRRCTGHELAQSQAGRRVSRRHALAAHRGQG